MQNKFGEFLKKLRLDRKLTLRDVETKAHISNAYLSQVERGERNVPTMKVLIKLADVYGIEVSVLNKMAEAELLDLDTLILADLDRSKPFDWMQFDNIPAPDMDFISKAYKKLSTEGKQKVKDYLLFITTQEKKK